MSVDEFEGEEREIKSKRTRANQINVRLSSAEAEQLVRIRQSTGLTTSAVIRCWIHGQNLPDRQIQIFVNEIRRQGGLMKHLASGTDAETGSKLVEIARQIMELAASAERKIRADDHQQKN